ncbi:MAG: EAL domain-containing protein [Lachnospiraceae bacterium]|nr:EAL domain-containing protein [Lachnospiraceae bacterium]
MFLSEELNNYLQYLFKAAADEKLDADSYKDICTYLNVSKMYYDMDLGGEERYRDSRTGNLVMAEKENDGKIILYDNGEETELKLTYPYYYYGHEYVHAYIEFPPGVKEEELDHEILKFFADTVYLLASRRNMRYMLDFAETMDALTGIPNIIYMRRQYMQRIQSVPPHELLVICANIQNFKYINEVGSARCGDEAIIQYSHKIVKFMAEDECACRLGGDNFAMFIHKEHLDDLLTKLNYIVLSNLKYAPDRQFELSAWVGISEIKEGDNRPIFARVNDATTACYMAKNRFKSKVVVFNDDLAELISRGHDIIAMFRPAIRDREFHPFFQPKIDMRTGELKGFEALCRWMHKGRFIYPDQFIPVLDREGFIPELDLVIFNETCATIRKWKDMGLTPPRISTNFSKKDLFYPDIEDKIADIIIYNGVTPDDLEIEITESVKDNEYDRLIDFVRSLKAKGLHISIDDFGTGYSSLSLIHNIDADVIKIDKSFIDMLSNAGKSRVLIESIIGIADNLHMSTIAEGVETAEQGANLLGLGCHIAQGYYYSKPVPFEEATEYIRNPKFKPIIDQ